MTPAHEILVPTNIENYYKDITNGVLINTDNTEYDRIVALREKRRKDRDVVREIDNIKNDLKEIKEMILSLAERNRES